MTRLSFPRWCFLGLVAQALLLGGCGDDLVRSTGSDPGGECATAGGSGCLPGDSTGTPLRIPVLSASRGGLKAPVRLTSTPYDWVLAADADLRLVVHLDERTLEPLEDFQVRGRPMGIAVLGDAFYVANVDARTVDVHSVVGGHFESSIALGLGAYPNDLDADSRAGLLFVLDGGRGEVAVFDAFGHRIRTISGKGEGPERLQAPVGLGLDRARRRVVVSDYGAPHTGLASIKVFSYEGEHIGTIAGTDGCGSSDCPGSFSRPQSPTVDAKGRIWVPDAVQGTLLAFDGETLAFQRRVGDRSLFRVPTDIVLDSLGNAFVTTSGARPVQILRGLGGS